MKDATRTAWSVAVAALLVVALPQSAQAVGGAEDESAAHHEEPMAAMEDAEQLELVPARQRSPFFVEVDAGVGPRFGLASSWGTTAPIGTDVRAGIGMWRGERMALFANAGVVSMVDHSVERYRAPASVTERFRLLPLRLGAKVNLRSHPSWLELNIIGGASLAVGKRDLVFGNSNNRLVASDSVFSLGAGGGVEVAMVKFKTTGVSLKAEYYVQPAILDDEAGYMTGGLTDLGGATLNVGWVYFLGGPQ